MFILACQEVFPLFRLNIWFFKEPIKRLWKIKLLNAPAIKFVENWIADSLKSELKDYVDKIENEIDLRYESVVESLEKYRSECKSKLFKFKEDFEK